MLGFISRLVRRPSPPREEPRVAGTSQRVRVTRDLLEVPADRQALEFLAWLQQENGRVGDVYSHELMEMHWEFCAWKGWKIAYWQRVAHELALLIGGASRVTRINGKSQRVWHIPKRSLLRVAGDERVVPLQRQRALGGMAA